jgi:hypothetical protein
MNTTFVHPSEREHRVEAMKDEHWSDVARQAFERGELESVKVPEEGLPIPVVRVRVPRHEAARNARLEAGRAARARRIHCGKKSAEEEPKGSPEL